MEFKRSQKWYGRPAIEGSGQISDLRQEIPEFIRRKFAIDKGVNKYLHLIVRQPLREDPGYLLPSDDQVELQIPVAIVSKEYELVQHHRIVTALETALEEIDLDPEKLNAKLILTEYYGERMRVSFTLPDYKFDPGDGGEVILLQVNALNSVDKTTPLEINLTWCSVNFMTGMPAVRGARFKKKHLKSRTPLESIIKEFLKKHLRYASRDIQEFQKWHQTKVFNRAEAKPSPDQIKHWLGTTVEKRWGKSATNKIYKIAKTGVGSFAPVRNVYDISQLLSWWVNSQPRTLQQRLDMMRDIPDLIAALLMTKKPITLSI